MPSSTAPTWWRCAARSRRRADAAIDEASADVTAVLTDGQRIHLFVEHAIGSLQRPLSDAQLDAKFALQSDPILGRARTAELIAACRRLGELPDLRRPGSPRTSLNEKRRIP